MKSYYYQSPFVKGSTTVVDIFNDGEEKTSSIQRSYKTLFHRLIDYYIGDAKH